MKNYFLPINSANISHYFRNGIILPSRYIKGNGWINDIQSKFNNSILLCSKPITEKSNCSLTIVFTDEEQKYIKQISNNFFVFNKPLPISRVKQLNFVNEEQSKTTVYNIEQGDAYVPKLISIIDNQETVNISELEKFKNTNNTENWEEKIGLFNRVLGGFSIMQIADVSNLEYPFNYFNTLSLINKEVENKIKDFNFENNYAPYINIKEKRSAIYGKINLETVSKYAKEKEGFDLPIKRGLIRLEEINNNKNSYLLAILATYGNDAGKPKKISDFISSLINENFNSKIKEKLCLIFGINQGYSAFKNEYNIQGQKIKTKFKLDSEVDYSIIESVYQYVFNDKRDNTRFSYISEWCPKFNNNIDLRVYETYRVFDKEIIYKKKAHFGSPEYLHELFQLFSKNSLLAPIFNLFKENVINSIQSIIKDIYNKIKSDIELEEKIKKQNIETKQLNLKKQIENLQNENKKLKEKIQEISKPTKLIKEELQNNVEEAKYDKLFNIKADKKAVINKRKEIISKTSKITELKIIGKYVGIKSISNYKASASDVEKLRRLIIEKEEEINK